MMKNSKDEILIFLRGLAEYLSTFKGKTIEELQKIVNLQSNSKSKNFLVIKRICESYDNGVMFNILFGEGAFLVKTINLNGKGFPEEAMSFPAFKYSEIISKDWETSDIKKALSLPFLVCVFRRNESVNALVGVKIWEMPISDLEGEVKEIYLRCQSIIKSCLMVKSVGTKIKLNFPKESETNVCHIRPHGRNGLDIDKLPSNDKSTNYVAVLKQSFWLNKKYIYNKIVREGGLYDN